MKNKRRIPGKNEKYDAFAGCFRPVKKHLPKKPIKLDSIEPSLVEKYNIQVGQVTPFTLRPII